MLVLSLVYAQETTPKYGDKDVYLIDSVPLHQLGKMDRYMLDSIVAVYPTLKDDTSRIRALQFLGENIRHQIWVEYNNLCRERVVLKLKEELNPEEIFFLSIGGSRCYK